jgi:hypothetical protein
MKKKIAFTRHHVPAERGNRARQQDVSLSVVTLFCSHFTWTDSGKGKFQVHYNAFVAV